MDHREAGRYWDANADTWTTLVRQGYDTCRNCVNTPAFFGMLPPVEGLRGLDIGCGEGYNTRLLAGRGAEVTALDISPRFVAHARSAEQQEPRGIRFLQASAHELPFPDEAFDFATAFMCLMDMPEPQLALAEAIRVIRPGGFLQFSITHPCYDLPDRRKIRDESGATVAYRLGGYFNRYGGEVLEWMFSAAPPEAREGLRPIRQPFFRHTLSWWLNAIAGAGFILEQVVEPCPDGDVLRQQPDLDDMAVIAFFIIFRCRKPA